MTLPPELMNALMEVLRQRTYSRPHQRRAFLERLFDAPSTSTDLAKVASIGVPTAGQWRRHVLNYCKEAGVGVPHYFHAKTGRPPARPPQPVHQTGQPEDPSAQPVSASTTLSGEEGDMVFTPDTSPLPREPQNSKRRKPFVDNDTFRAFVDDMIEDAHGARDHKAFSAVGKLKVDVTPGLKVPDTHLNINVSFLGPRGLEALNDLLTDRIARLLLHRDRLPEELQGMLSDKVSVEDLIEIAPVSASSTDEALVEVVDTGHESEDIDAVFDEH